MSENYSVAYLQSQILDELVLHGVKEDSINVILHDLKGRKREEEMLKYLKENEDTILELNEIINMKNRIIKQYSESWGFVQASGDYTYLGSYYSPKEYIKQLKYLKEMKPFFKYRLLSENEIDEIFNIRNDVYEEKGESPDEAWNCIVEKLNNFNKSKRRSVNRVLYTYGNVEDNMRNLICPRCKTKYIGTHMYCVPSNNDKLNMKKVGLHDDPLNYKSGVVKPYYCLCCGLEWGVKEIELYDYA